MFNFPDLEKIFAQAVGCGIIAVIITFIIGLGVGWLIWGR